MTETTDITALLARAKALDAARTPGAWKWEIKDELYGRRLISTEGTYEYVAGAQPTGYESVTVDISRADEEFIAAASELIPQLIAALEATLREMGIARAAR